MSLQRQFEQVKADNERLIRQRIHDAIVHGGGDPTTSRSLHAIDNYRPAWSERSQLRRVFSLGAIGDWSQHHFNPEGPSL